MRPIKAYIQLSLAMIIVGSSVVAGKILTDALPVFLASGLGLTVAVIVFVVILIAKEKRIPTLSRRDFKLLLLQAFVGTVLFRVFLLYGLRSITAAEGGLITSTGPAVMAVLAVIFLKEKLGIRKVVGIVFSVSGLAAIQLLDVSRTTFTLTSLIGFVLLFGSVISENMFSVLAKPLSKTVTPLQTASFVTIFSFLMFLVPALYEGIGFDFRQLRAEHWLAIGYYGIFITVIAFLLWFAGLKHVEASTAGVFTALIPVSSLTLSYLVLGEAFVWTHAIGFVCILIGILLITVIFRPKEVLTYN